MNQHEKEFFDRLAEKLDEIFPKTNQDHPEIPSEGNRSGALVLNAYANIIFKDISKHLLAAERERIAEKIEKLNSSFINGKGVMMNKFEILNCIRVIKSRGGGKSSPAEIKQLINKMRV